MARQKRYDVLTWDDSLQQFTPQKGVRRGPYTLFGLRRPLRALREMGYGIRRSCAPSVLVQMRGNEHPWADNYDA